MELKPSHLRLIASSSPPGGAPDSVSSLLSPEDLVEVERYGVPAEPRADLVQQAGAAITLSAKGLQYYTASVAAHLPGRAITPTLSKADFVQLESDLFDAVRQKVRGELQVEYDAGRIDPRDRAIVEAKLKGSAVDLCVSLRRSLNFSAAGENIIPLGLKKKRRS